jgi:uncharacterized protein YggE
MKKLVLLLISAVMVLGLVLSGCAAPVQGSQIDKVAPTALGPQDIGLGSGVIWSQQNIGLWVTAEGKVNAAPDIALLEVGVEVQKEDVAQAQQQAAQSMSAVMSAIKANGIADKDIQTSQYSIYPVRNWDDKKNQEYLVGYRVTNTVTVKIRKIEDAGSIIDAVTSAAGDDVRINNISFTIDDPTPFYKEAREKAVKYAMEKASQIASTSGIKLGKPIYISESTPFYQPIVSNFAKGMDMAPAAAPAPTDISGGQLEVSVSIQIVYEIN